MNQRICHCIIATVFFLSAISSFAGLLGPGKYSGVVIFDRWDGCALCTGVFVVYVSEKTKEALRPYKGQAMQIDATEVYQPVNPGDGLIGNYTILGPAVESRKWIKTDGIQLFSSLAADTNGQPVATLVMTNSGNEPATIFSSELGFTLLKKKEVENEKNQWIVSDGPSYAFITRLNFEGRYEGGGIAASTNYSWTIGKENVLPHDFVLEPGCQKTLKIRFNLPEGEYDFLAGYPGLSINSRCLASNLSAFDIKSGKTKIVKRSSSATMPRH